MAKTLAWNLGGHQVAIAGNAFNAQTGEVLRGVQVTITSAPRGFKNWLKLKALAAGERWETLTERPDRTRTAADGHFHFLNLPTGQYGLTATLPEAGQRYGTVQAKAKIARDAKGRIVWVNTDLALPPTALQGQLLNADKKPVVLAEVQILGSGETLLSDEAGQYLFASLEPGKRTVRFSARGYQTVSRTVSLTQGEPVVLDLTLSKE